MTWADVKSKLSAALAWLKARPVDFYVGAGIGFILGAVFF